jgi:RNA polymerase sigma-70 factor (family 1)
VNHNANYTDNELFQLIAEGDENAFRMIFHRYNKKFYPFILSLLKSEEDARDVIQDIFLKLWVQKDSLSAIENPGAWLRTLSSNAAYDFLRKAATYQTKRMNLQGLTEENPSEFWQKWDAKETREILNEAIEKLPLRRRQIFKLSKIDGYSRKEIAEKLDISENTVRNQLVEAVDFVQTYLQQNNLSSLVSLSVLLIILH